jgi:hypothetical protein
MKLPKTKLAAIKVGSITYDDGKICKHGHKGPRYVSAGCVQCVKLKAKRRRPTEDKRRKKKTIEKLKSIVRICKRRLCDNEFSPENRSDQVFCSERCNLIQGREDWKKEIKKVTEFQKIFEKEKNTKQIQSIEREKNKNQMISITPCPLMKNFI